MPYSTNEVLAITLRLALVMIAEPTKGITAITPLLRQVRKLP